jgi:hypothetical protein
MAISDFFSGGQTPDYLSGLLDDEQLRRLKQNAQQNALMQFGLSALAQGGYSATPVGIGEILGKSGMAGMQGYQQGIQSGIEGIGTRAKLEELQRKREQQKQIDTMIGGITDPAEALAARIAPEQYVTSKFKPKSSFNILSNEQAAAYQLPTDSGQRYQMTDKGVELISGTQTKDVAPTNLEKLQTYRTSLMNADPNDPRIKQIDAAINKETNFAPPMQSVNNIQNFVPAAQALQKDAASALVKNYELLQNAPQTIDTMEQAKKLIPQAVSFTGSFGEQKLQLAKFFNNNFGTSIDATGVQNAEQLRSALFANVMDNLKKMDASPSQEQQRVMAKAFGTLETDPSSLPKIIDIYENVIKKKVDIHNQRVDQIKAKIELPYDLKVNLPPPAPVVENLQERINRIRNERKGKR